MSSTVLITAVVAALAAWLVARQAGQIRHLRRRSALLAAGQELMGCAEEQALGASLDRMAREHLRASGWILERCPGRSGPLSPDMTRRLGPARSAAGRDAALTAQARRAIAEARPVLGGRPGRSSRMACPVLARGRVIGAIAVRGPGAVFGPTDLELLGGLARALATAIDHLDHVRMARLDALTGFFQRPYFFRRLDEEYRRARRYHAALAVLMVDVDSFKSVNDGHGHLAGDRRLRAIARTVRSRLRDADLPCRFGGDEFCVLLPETDLAGASAIAERIRRAVSGDGLSTVSIGVAAIPQTAAADSRSLLREADRALYVAKRAGRDRVVPSAA